MFRRQSELNQTRSQVARMAAGALRITLLLGIFVQVFGFETDRRLSQHIHKSWQTEQGLPQNAVFCLVQDHDQFLWFGTENGLVRFDGVRFEVFNEVSDPPVPHNFTSSLLVAQDGTLWAGTRTGGLFTHKNGRFEVPIPELAQAKVRTLCESDDGTLWVGTVDGLFRVRDGTATQVKLPADVRSVDVTALAPIREGAVWVGTREGEILKSSGNTATLVLPGTIMPVGGAIKAFAFNAKASDLWIARDGGILQLYQTNSLRTIDLFPGRGARYLQVLHLDTDGALWIGTKDDGLIRYADGEVSRFTAEEGLPDQDILSILKDHEGSLWVGTHYGGLNRLLEGRAVTFAKREGLPFPIVSCVVEANAEGLWLGTAGGGLYKYSHCEFTAIPLGNAASDSKDIRGLHLTKNGDLWIGTYGGGLALYRTNQPVRFFKKEDGLADNFVTLIFERRNGELWIGTRRDGITVVDPVTGAFRNPVVPDFLRTHIRTMAEDSGGTLWIGTQNGLVRYANETFEAIKFDQLPELSVRYILCDRDDTLWIGSRDHGLLRLKAGKMQRFHKSEGLRHNRIYQVLAQGEDLWLAGNQGIEHFKRAELERVAANPKQPLITQLLTKNEGLRTPECGGDYSPSAMADANGILWFGTKEGLVRIDPEVNKKLAKQPKVLITSVSADNQRTHPGAFTGLKPGTARVQFNYTALAFRDPDNIFFKYKMDKVDPEWISAGRSREAVYYNLRPGSYKFHVTASNDEGTWNEEGALLAFTVAPMYYQTVWFRSLAGFGILYGMVVGYRARVRSMRSRNRQLEGLVTDRTKELETEVLHRSDAEQQLRALNEELEIRVKTRTLELERAYVSLEVQLHERHQAEHALARSEARLRRIVDSGMIGILFWQKDGAITDANNTFLRMIGYSREDLVEGRINWQAMTPPEHLHLDHAALEEIEKTGLCAPFEKEYIRRDGTRFPILLGGASLSPEGDKGVCFMLDISARKASEEEVRRLNLLLEARVQERTTELARTNQQLAAEVNERKRVAIALSAFSHLGQKLHSARTEKEAATIVAESARSLIPHDSCSIELYSSDGRLTSMIDPSEGSPRHTSNGSQCSISVSIRNGSRVVGILGLKSSNVEGFTFEDANTLQALGDYCGGALERIHAEEARRDTERRFSTFMTNAPALAWMKDAQFRYVFTNEMFQRFTGLAAGEIEGRTDYDLWPEGIAAHMRENDMVTKANQAKRETQERLKRHDGEIRTLLTLRFLFTTGTGEQYVAGMAVDITEQKKAEDALHRLPQSILEAQETERRRVARELHDGVNQAIASVKFRIQTAEQQILRADPKWQETCSKTKDMLDSVLNQVRRLSRNLRPGELDDFGLVPAARSACQEMEMRTGVSVKFTHSEFPDRLPPALELSLYRIIQEALTNVEKHSAATEVAIGLEEDGSYVLLEISDNGCGFEPATSHSPNSGLGLLHMRERASLVGGVFALVTAPGEGVRMTIHAPISRTIEAQ